MNTRRLLQSFMAIATLLLMAAFTTAGNANAQTIYVDSSGGSDAACNGTSPNVATIPNCPKQTLGAALGVVAVGGTIEMAAGTYPGGPFTFANPGLTVQARNVGPNTDVFFTGGGVTVTSSVTFASVGGVFYNTGGSLTLGGVVGTTMTIDAAGTYNFPAGGTITRTNGALAGAAPTFLGAVTLLYNATSADIQQVAGNEVPATLAGGTLTISMTAGTVVTKPTLTFPTSFTAGVSAITGGNTSNVTFSGTLTAASVTVSDANTHSFFGAAVTAGNFVQDTAASTITVGDLATNGFRVTSGVASGLGTFTSTGTVSTSAPVSNNGAAGDGGGVSWIVHGSVSPMSLNHVTVAGTDADGASDTYTHSIQNTLAAGSLTISGTVTEINPADGAFVDLNLIELLNDVGTFTVTLNNSFSGFFDNAAAFTFSAGGTLNGDVDNTGTTTISSGTLDLTADPGVFMSLVDFDGPAGTLLLSGGGDVGAGGITAEGNVTLAGDNDGVGGASLTVGGVLTISGSATWVSPGGGTMTVTGGNATFTGTLGGFGLGAGNTLVVSSGDALFDPSVAGDILASLTISGDLTVQSGSDLDGVVSVGGTTRLEGLNDIGDGDGDVFSTGGDLIIGSTTFVDAPGTTTNAVGGTLMVLSGGTLTFLDDNNVTYTVDAVDIFQQTGGGPPNGSVTLGNDNTLVVQGSFSGGFFDGRDGGPGHAADADADNALLAFVMPDNNSTFSPGPNTQLCDFSAFGNELTLSVTVSFEVQCNAFILDDSTLDLTNVLMRMTGPDGSLSIAVDAEVTSDPTTGAVSFEGTDVNLDGFIATIDPVAPSTGHITSFIVNNPAFLDVGLTGSVEVNGIISLAFGGVTTGANTLTFTGPDAGIIINTDGGGADLDIVTGGPGALAGSWDVTYNGANGVMGGVPGVEYHPTNINDLTINTTAGPTTLDVLPLPFPGYSTQSASISGNFTVSSASAPTVVDPLTVAGNANIALGGTVAVGGSGVTFSSGSVQAHTIAGTFAAPATFATDATVDGVATGTHTGPVTVAGDLTVTAFENYTMLITILSGANFTVGFTDNDLIAPSVIGADATVSGVSILGTGTWTQTTDASQVGGTTFDVGDGTGIAGFDMGGNVLDLYGGSAFTADFDANIAQNGLLRASGGGVLLNTDIGATGNAADVLAFTNNDGGAFIAGGGGFEVVGTSDINAVLSGPGFYHVSGTVHMGAFIGAPTTILGTTVNVEGNQTFTSSLTINSPTTGVDFVEASIPLGQVALDIDGLYTQTAGDVSYNDVHLIVDGGFSWFSGLYTAGDADDEFHLRGGGFTTNSGQVVFRTVRVSGGTKIMGTALSVNDAMQINDLLFLNSDLQVGSVFGAGCVPGDLTIGDGAGNEEVAALGGNVNLACGSVVHTAPEMLKVAYGSSAAMYPTSFLPGATAPPAVTNDELPAAAGFLELEVNLAGPGVGGLVGLDRTPTVDLLDLNAGGFAGGVAVPTINITDGGTVQVSTGPGGLTTPLTFDGDWTLDYAAGGFTIGVNEWPVAATPTTFMTSHLAGITTVGAPIRTAHHINIGAGSTLDLGATGLNVTGNLTVPGTVISTGAGPLIIVGAAPQLTTAAMTLPIVVMNNPTGLTLGGSLTIAGPPAPAPNLALMNGVIHTTAAFTVNLPHGGTAFQGFTRPAPGGAIDGNVTKVIVGGPAPMPADVMSFPTGTPGGNYRPGEITLNDPSQVSGVAASGITLTFNHTEGSPLGANNMPLQTERFRESTDPPGTPPTVELLIARYAPFFWTITASTNLSPSVDYDVRLEGNGYLDFVDENIERVRMIRRQAGNVNNFWQLVGATIASNDNQSDATNTDPVAVVKGGVGAIIAGTGTRFTMGLESNMTVTNPGPFAMNMGQSIDVDLTTVFGGGTPLLAGPPPSYSYATSAAKNAPAVSAAVAGDVLTISGIAEGAGTVTVTATDQLNDSRTVEIAVQVNPVFMANAIDDAELNVGGSHTTYVVNLNDVFDGGTPPVGFALANDNPGSATAAIAGTTLTVTAVSAGTVNIDVTGTDQTGADATSSFTVNVNAALAGSAIADVDLKEDDAAHEVDLSTVFSGGDGSYTYAVSTDAAHINASESGGTLSASVVTAFAGSPLSTIGTIDVDVTATDGLGDSAMATLTVDVFPATGNVLGAGPSPADAAATLDHFLGVGAVLTAKQIGAADMNGDALVTPFDAAQNFAAFFGKDGIQAVVASYLQFGEVAQDGAFVEIPLQVVGGDLGDVVSASFEAQLNPEAIMVQGIETDLGDEWLVKHSVTEEGVLKIGIAGYGDIGSDGTLATIKLQLIDRGSEFKLSANGAVNDNEVSKIDEVEIVELPETFALQGNYPNPFNPSTTIQFDLPETADVEIQIFDMLGRRAMVIPAQSIEAGVNRSIQLNASALASGSYFYRVIARMDSKTLVESGRMMLVK